MANQAHSHAVTLSRFWWNRYRTLPWWRPLAKRQALAEAEYWGREAINLKTSE